MLNYRKLKARVDAYEASVLRRARAECRKAGIHPDYLGTALHNALLAAKQGRPWSEVNYHHARKAAWLLKRQDAARRCLDRLYERKDLADFCWS